MDSITQAALGAAVGHAVLGKKMGNRAIIIGAIAGTIPDLDIVTSLFASHELFSLKYHRGISHSLLFNVLIPPLLAWLSLLYYKKEWHEDLTIQRILAVWWGVFYGGVVGAIGYSAYQTSSPILWVLAGVFLLGGVGVYFILRRSIEKRSLKDYDPRFWRWTLMYALGFCTHWLIDTCTSYGTQIFEPFASTRVTFNNIAIMDPLYTLPLLVGLLGAIWAKDNAKGKRWNYGGLIVSTLYMLLTVGIKMHVNTVVERSLAEQNIEYEAYITYPSILNAVLWQTTIRSADTYHYGTYSLLDKDDVIDFIELPLNHHLVDQYEGNKYIEILKWFGDGYYNFTEHEDGTLTFNNLRFGLLGVPTDQKVPEMKDRYVFRYNIKEKDGQLEIKKERDFDRIKVKDVWLALLERVQGK